MIFSLDEVISQGVDFFKEDRRLEGILEGDDDLSTTWA